MIRFIPYVLKTLWRHRSRTLLTVSGSAVSLFVFSIVVSVQEGMRDLTRRQHAHQSLVAFQAHKFCPATSHLPQDYENAIRQIAGVRDVVPIQVFTNNCRASLDVVVFHGLPPEKLRALRDFRLSSGSWAKFEQRRDAACVGKAVANRKQLEVEDTYEIGGVRVNVAGIFSSNNPAEENYIYTHLDFLQRRQGENRVGTVTQFEVFLDAGTDSDVACQAIDNLFQSGPIPTTTRPKGAFQAGTLGDLAALIEMAGYLGYACLGLVLVLVATTTLMSVQDRIQEHAVLQTIGFSGSKVFGLVLCESVILSFSGGVLGLGTAVALLQFSGLPLGAEGVIIAFGPSFRLALTGAVASVIIGLSAGLIPAWQAARTEIVPALRHV